MDQKTHEYSLSQSEPIITECKNSGLPTPIIEPISTQAPIVLHIKGCTIEVNNNATPELIATIMQVMSHA